MYDYPKPRVRCRGRSYTRNNKPVHEFKGWIDSPWDRMEARETGRDHPSQLDAEKVEKSDEVIPASSTTYYNLAFKKLK